MSEVQRYKIGYSSDEWGMRSSTPSGIPDAGGFWVKYSDYAALAAVPAQERIDALELEVWQLTEQIAELRGGGAAKEYAELPESCYEDDSGLKTYDSGDMRTFADATHALRTGGKNGL